jgi:hypothetical protein
MFTEAQARDALRRLADDAIRVQDACNLSGVAQSFAEACITLRLIAQALGLPGDTEWCNRHPIVTLWVDKLCDLNGHCGPASALNDEYSQAVKIVQDIAHNGKIV